MTIQYKSAIFDIKDGGDEGKISGYANVYGVEDLGGDIVEKGAFSDFKQGGTIPMLWGHNSQDLPIGVWTKVVEDEHGLYVEGSITRGDPVAERVLLGARSGAITGLSIGYSVLEETEKKGVRHIHKARLFETSLVTFPMNIESRIDAVKAAVMTERELESSLTRGKPLSRSVARMLIRGGFKEIQAKQDAGLNSNTGKRDAADGEADMLKSILTEIRAAKRK